MKRFESFAAAVFGLLFLLLAVAVATETITRKVFNYSLQGVDELGGYILAVGAALSFAVALVSRAHIRIDIVHEHFPRFMRIALNLASALALLVCAAALTRMAWIAWSDSVLFASTAQTPWATPLRYPQALWLAAMGIFLAVAVLQILRMIVVAARDGVERIDKDYSPRGSKEELEEELQDIKARGAAEIDIEKSLRA
jgi:TRAP-type C4-dicarboxylate transport system permease small subunit